jgi:hypothetical protein
MLTKEYGEIVETGLSYMEKSKWSVLELALWFIRGMTLCMDKRKEIANIQA